jgi:glucan phosphoethanolaminetransferase (alkaline phosphatase superfamily)
LPTSPEVNSHEQKERLAYMPACCADIGQHRGGGIYFVMLPLCAVVAWFIALIPMRLRNSEEKINADDIFAITGLMVFLVFMSSLLAMGITRSNATVIIFSFVAAFAVYMLFRAFREGARERKRLAEAEQSAPQVKENEKEADT